ncbi:nucleotidyl transferase AbiEii/AbiGii toxin family protein [bacterium]|nr:nucleotidyl transferase AbiEii/AbiGii toxin family protein [bacterium]
MLIKGKGIISKSQKNILHYFSKLKDSKYFYLTGGTALAEFYLGHRKSYDLDLFTSEKSLILPFSRLLEEQFKKLVQVKVIRRFETFVEFEIEEEETVRVQLAYDSPFKFEKPLESDLGILVNSYKDLIIDKLLALYGRAEPRDAVDIFFILKTENFWDMVKLASIKDPGFDLYWLAVALEKVTDFPNELDRWPVQMLIRFKVEELKNKFSLLAREIMEKIRTSRTGESPSLE